MHKEGVKFTFGQVESEMRFVEGKILTIIDSVIPEGKQNKAVKDIVKDDFGNCINFFFRASIGEDKIPKKEFNVPAGSLVTNIKK